MSAPKKAFDEIQKIGATDARDDDPDLAGRSVATVRDGINGVEETFDPSFIFRFWLISKDQ